MEKTKKFQKVVHVCILDYNKVFDYVVQNTLQLAL